MKTKINKPIFIVGPHRSGTTLLLRLFDGHPELFTIPFETHFFEHAGYQIDYEGRKKYPMKLTNNEIKSNYFKLVERLTENRNINSEEPILSHNRFKRARFEQKNQSFKELVENYFISIYSAIYDKPFSDKLRIVEKSVEHAEFVPLIKKMFPDAKFIHLIRNPYAYMNSYRSYLQTKNFPLLRKPLLSLKNNLYHLYRNKELFPEDYMTIRFEDLVINTNWTMMKIHEFLNIDNHKNLYKPTLIGKEWFANSFIHKDLNEVSTKPVKAWEKTIGHLEVYYINKYFSYHMKKCGYDRIKPKRHKNIPMKGETIRNYILNRTLEYNCLTGTNIEQYLKQNELKK